jgi:hypothetical protein
MLASLARERGMWFIFGLCPKMNHALSHLSERSER